MNMHAQGHGASYISAYFDTALDVFLAPVSGENPAGEYLRYQALYREINEARRADDASLPLGVWGHELKRANWQQVSRLALGALTSKSKDIQLVVWLLEAEIHQQGFRAIAPVLNLLAELCREFWPVIHPHREDDDDESRVNLIAWIDEKLLPVLRLTPFTSRSGHGKDYCLADWMIARKQETLKKDERDLLPRDSPTLEMIEQAMTDSPSAYYVKLREILGTALHSVDHVCHTLDSLCAGNGPSLSSFSELLCDILDLVEIQMNKRGLPLASMDEMTESGGEVPGLAEADAGAEAALLQQDGTEVSRVLIYQQLERMANYLIETDPHSPAPYLVIQACKWGRMGTRELYQELFVTRQGQLHIFDLLGVNNQQAATEQA